MTMVTAAAGPRSSLAIATGVAAAQRKGQFWRVNGNAPQQDTRQFTIYSGCSFSSTDSATPSKAGVGVCLRRTRLRLGGRNTRGGID